MFYSDRLLVAEIIHVPRVKFDTTPPFQPRWLTVYDLATKSEKCSIRLRHKYPIFHSNSAVLYALSPTGSLAVIQGTKLSLYQP